MCPFLGCVLFVVSRLFFCGSMFFSVVSLFIEEEDEEEEEEEEEEQEQWRPL